VSDKVKRARRAYLDKRAELADAVKEARSREAVTQRGQEASAEEARQTFPALRGRS